jgi:hypothetical protein
VDVTGFHELSGVRILSRDRMVAVTDRGHFVDARLLFDEEGRLSGLADARLIPVVDEQGATLSNSEADGEGLDVLASGDRFGEFRASSPDRAVPKRRQPFGSRATAQWPICRSTEDGGPDAVTRPPDPTPISSAARTARYGCAP